MYFNSDIADTLTTLRKSLRDGNVHVSYRADGAKSLRLAVAAAFGIGPDDFNTENFKKAALKRFAAFFDVPSYIETAATGDGSHFVWPTQDDTAWALQNFINRRSHPWSFWTDKNTVVTATSADPIAQAIGDMG